MNRDSRIRAFSLVELMIVIGSIGTLASYYALNAQSAVRETRAVACGKNRCLLEDMEMKFQSDHGRPSMSPEELVAKGYVNKARCPQGGTFAWIAESPDRAYERQALVCSVHGPKTRICKFIDRPQEGEKVDPNLFASNFDDGTAKNWTERAGKYWQFVGGAYRAGSLTRKTSGEHVSSYGDESWTDYDPSADVSLLLGNGYALRFRATGGDKADGYLLAFEPKTGGGRVVMRRMRDGKEKEVFANTGKLKGFDWYEKAHAVKVEVRGSTFTAYVDGNKLLTGTDKTYTKGAVAIRSTSNSVTEFDNVKVRLAK